MALLVPTALATDRLLESGRSVYRSNCLACHGESGDGQGPAAIALDPKPTDFTSPDFWADRDAVALRTAIRAGTPGTTMLGFPHLSDHEVLGLVVWLESWRPADEPAREPEPSAEPAAE